jgi:hypothetical protein
MRITKFQLNLQSQGTWSVAQERFGKEFDARAFLVKNVSTSDLQWVYLVNFERPDEQIIPEIGEQPQG